MSATAASMRALPAEFAAYRWAPATEALARSVGLDPSQIIRFDGNTAPLPLPSSRPGAIAGALANINAYPHGGYPDLLEAIAQYAGVNTENVVLGAGADDLILLCARSFLGPGDRAAIADHPTYPLYAIAIGLAGAEVSKRDPALTFACRPNNPSGALDELPDARPLVVDEAYFEYAGRTALDLIDEGVIVIRTFSKAFALAGARVGYAIAEPAVAEELNRRQAPLAVATLSAALATAALRSPPEVGSVVDERERLAVALRSLDLNPLPSRANFLFVPVDKPEALGEAILEEGVVVRIFDDGIRISIRDREDDDLLLEALARALDRPAPDVALRRRVRSLRATAETRIAVRLGLDGAARVRVDTGAGIYDHFLEQLAFHAGFDLVLEGAGDLETGPHHTAEDGALAFGNALDLALGDRRGIARYGNAVVPMDDAVARASVDLGGRPWCECDLERDPGLAGHMFQSLSQAARMGLHIEATGQDDHHVAESAFKAVGRALRVAVRPEGAGVPSTKGIL